MGFCFSPQPTSRSINPAEKRISIFLAIVNICHRLGGGEVTADALVSGTPRIAVGVDVNFVNQKRTNYQYSQIPMH